MDEQRRLESWRQLENGIFDLVDRGDWRRGLSPESAGPLAADVLLVACQVYLKLMPYDRYLKTHHWKEISGTAKARAGYACELCGSKEYQLNVHHKTYERRGYERPEDLIVLCRPCHAKFHDKLA